MVNVQVGQKLFDKPEASRILHVSISLLDHLTAAKGISHLKLGKKCYYTAEDLEKYMLSRRVESSAIEKPRASKASSASPSRRARASSATA